MKYIIDEDELFFLIGESEYRDRKTILINIKESRKPVEEVTEEYQYSFVKHLRKGKPVKIYIEEGE